MKIAIYTLLVASAMAFAAGITTLTRKASAFDRLGEPLLVGEPAKRVGAIERNEMKWIEIDLVYVKADSGPGGIIAAVLVYAGFVGLVLSITLMNAAKLKPDEAKGAGA